MKKITGLMKNRSFRRNSGFISTYFFALFLYCLSLIAIISENHLYRLETVRQIEEVNLYLSAEIRITNALKCRLLNEAYDPEPIVIDDIYALPRFREDRIEVEVLQPVRETLLYTLQNHSVYDYESVREHYPSRLR